MSSFRAWAASVIKPKTNQNQMIVFGGVDQNNVTLDSIEIIDIKARKSMKISLTLPTPLAGHCAVQLNSSHTFVAGGATAGLAGFGESSNFSNQAWILSDAGWTNAGQMVQARSVHSCSLMVTRGGGLEVLIVGGIGLSRVGTRMVLDSVEMYNVATGRWRKGHKLPYPVFGAGLLELAGQPMLIGGRYQEEDQLLQSDDSFIYQHSWRSATLKMRNPRDLAVTVAAPAGC
jgi:N-acetylneuraminic acid mutarotase